MCSGIFVGQLFFIVASTSFHDMHYLVLDGFVQLFTTASPLSNKYIAVITIDKLGNIIKRFKNA